MLATQLADTIAAAPSLAAIDNLARLTWRGLAENLFDDATASRLQVAIEARRAVLRGQGYRTPRSQQNASSDSPARPRRQSSPNRRRSIQRRRRLAASGVVPNRIAAQFTQSEVAVLTVIGRQVKKHGRCTLPIDAIAAMAGTCRTVVQNTLREARRLGILRVIERRITGFRNDTNVVTIVSPEWRTWLRLGGVGSEKRAARTNKNKPNTYRAKPTRIYLPPEAKSGINRHR